MPTVWFGEESPPAGLSWSSVQWLDATSLALPAQPRGESTEAYGLAPLTLKPSAAGAWVGRRAQGSPVNCDDAHLCIHSGGTHTECAAHVSDHAVSIADVAPLQLLRAVLIELTPRHDASGDAIIYAADLCAAWTQQLERHKELPTPNVIVIRTRSTQEVPHRVWSGTNPPYFQPEALSFLVDAGVEHLVTDLPSLDRESDGGALLAHRTFFGVEPVVEGRAAIVTVTELAWIPAALTPGIGLLRLDVLAWDSDAAPSRPIYYPIVLAG